MPPYMAGRELETNEFRRLLSQSTVLENLVLTGLRGLGKTVLLETFKPLAIQEGWLWAGTDLSESASISEEKLAIRLLTDLSVVTSPIVLTRTESPKFFRQHAEEIHTNLDFPALAQMYERTPGLVADKLKHVLETVWQVLATLNRKGVIFAYDEAQNLSDHAAKDQFPLSLLLDVFQSIQRKNIPFMLALTGLPTLFPKLVEARTFAERMFRVVFLSPLSREETRAAIQKPIASVRWPFGFSDESVEIIWTMTRGYPYFVQYVCRESFDVWVQNVAAGEQPSPIPVDSIIRKLDSDFFAGRWARATDRQRELLGVIARLEKGDGEFTVQEIVEESASAPRPFSSSHVNQMLAALGSNGLVYKNRHGKYSFAVPLMGPFILRQLAHAPLSG